MLPERSPGKKGVGIFGAGAMGQKHLEAWRALDVPIAGLYARDAERGRAAVGPFGVPVYDCVSRLLNDVEIADICLPTFLHRKLAEDAAAARCQIVCEKPLALLCEDAEAIFRACDLAKVRIFVAMVVRFFPLYRAVAERVFSGSLGAIREILLQRIVKTPSGERAWFSDEALSGGVVFDLLIHDIDYASWLAGDVYSVKATLKKGGGSQFVHLVLEHTSGATSTIEGGWSESMDGLSTAIRLTGDSGVLQVDPHLPSLFPALPHQDPYAAQLRHFQISLESNHPFEITRDEVLRALGVAAAAQTSIEQGRPVTLGSSPDRRSL